MHQQINLKGMHLILHLNAPCRKHKQNDSVERAPHHSKPRQKIDVK